MCASIVNRFRRFRCVLIIYEELQMSDANVTSQFWQELPEADNPFAAALCRCAGFDVYGDLLGKATATDYWFLLLRHEPPKAWERELLNGLAIAIGNPGPRDLSVHAAMSGGAGGSGLAACLMAALAPAAGNFGGAMEVNTLLALWQQFGTNIASWQTHVGQDFPLPTAPDELAQVWPALEHPPGFDPYGVSCSTPVRQALDALADCSKGAHLRWLRDNRAALETAARKPLALCAVAAAALADLGCEPAVGEMLYLLLRLPGAAAHALEQHERGWRSLPFYNDGLILTKDVPNKDPQNSKSTDN
jgi:citrate synthase